LAPVPGLLLVYRWCMAGGRCRRLWTV